MMFFSVGLTGGVGSGKSTVAQQLRTLGAAVVDTDHIAHQLTGPGGQAMPALQERFGAFFVNEQGALDRARMRAHVFSDAAAKCALEEILHPLIRQTAEAAALQAAAAAPYVVFMVPLLVESPTWHQRVARVLVVDCAVSTQIERVQKRNGWSEASVRAVLHAQATRNERLGAAHDVIVNEGDLSSADELDAFNQRIARLHQAYLAYARA